MKLTVRGGIILAAVLLPLIGVACNGLRSAQELPAVKGEAPVTAPIVIEQPENQIDVEDMPVSAAAVHTAMSSNKLAAAAKRFGTPDPTAATGARLTESGQPFVIIPYSNNERAALAFTTLPTGEEFAVNIEVLGDNRIRYTDDTGNGVELKVEVRGDQFRILDGKPIDTRAGSLQGALERLGLAVPEAQAFRFICWANCVMQRCPQWSWCYFRCGITCGACLATGWGCGSCWNCLGGLAIQCAIQCP